MHLDVKPGNIVMGIPPRLIDLSIARPITEAASLRVAIGTDPYMAPEQCDPGSWPGRIGAPADIWGLGATLFHAVSGRLPFLSGDRRRRDDPAARFPQIHEPPDVLPRTVPAGLADLILRMLRKDPDERPVAAEVVAVLEPLVAKITARH